MNIQEHLKRYPNARPSTLSYIAKREEKTAQLRSELDQASDRRARLLADADRGETIIGRFLRMMRKA